VVSLIVLLQCLFVNMAKTEREIAICIREMRHNYQTDVTCSTYKISQDAKNRAQNQVKNEIQKKQPFTSVLLFYQNVLGGILYNKTTWLGGLTNQMDSIIKNTEEPHQCQ
jgi:hypothetical protein